MTDQWQLLAPDEPVTLSNCDREPIHIPGAIQPHGLLFTATTEDWVVRQLSDTVATTVGRSSAELVGAPIAELGAELADVVPTAFAAMAGGDSSGPYVVDFAGARWELRVHLTDGLAVCELERAGGAGGEGERAGTGLESIEAVSELSQRAADEIKELTGYDRVMVYRFDSDGHGEVIAEAAEDRLDSFLGHHYPATDIPRQARALYLRQAVRMIVDIDYEPSPITPADNPLTGRPLDLSLSELRSVSPIHLEYLRNMGVTATLVISLIEDGELWGLVACHHYSPRHTPRATRTVCQAVGRQLSAHIAEEERREARRRRADLGVLSRQLLRMVHNAPTPDEGLRAGGNLLLRLADADGAAIVRGDERTTFGVVPTAEDERQIVALMPPDGAPLLMDRLTRDLPFVSANTDMCGVLAFALGTPADGGYIIWYRDEWVHDLTWGGDPRDSLRPDLTSTSLKSLSPRRSFEGWRQAVIGRSRPWDAAEVDNAAELAESLAGRL